MDDKTRNNQFFETNLFITTYNESAHPLIHGKSTSWRLNYQKAFFKKQNSSTSFKHYKETMAFDVHKNEQAKETIRQKS